MRSVEETASPHILTVVEPVLSGIASYSGGTGGSRRSPDMDADLNITLDDRDLWLRFQNLTNEMIVTKNGR